MELLASMMGENYDDVLKVVGTKKDGDVANIVRKKIFAADWFWGIYVWLT